MRIGIIYRATSPSGKKYYGRSIQPLSRRKYHHYNSTRNGSNLYFHNAIRKYGEDNIKWEIVEKIKYKTKEELIEILNEKEINYIDKDNTLCPNGYNLNKGGGNYCAGLSNRKGKTYEELYGKEKAENIRNKQRKNNSHYWKDRKVPKEIIEKRAFSNTGKKLTKETKEKIRQSLLGTKHTEERKRNISEAHKGKSFFAKNFGGSRYGKDNPNYIEINEKLASKIITLHTKKFLSAKKIAIMIKINGTKIINFLRDKNVYMTSQELNEHKLIYKFQETIINLHTKELLSAKKISTKLKINNSKVIKLLKEDNVYMTIRKLNQKRNAS
jgi:hypothetical protein